MNIAKKDKCDTKDTDHGQTNVSPELITNNLISFPGGIHYAVAKGAR